MKSPKPRQELHLSQCHTTSWNRDVLANELILHSWEWPWWSLLTPTVTNSGPAVCWVETWELETRGGWGPGGGANAAFIFKMGVTELR